MRSENDEVLAILASDIHASHTPPVFRSQEDWYGIMGRYFLQLREVASKFRAPIVIAGDLFNTWNEPAELINFVIDNLQEAYAIPGQHDLPFHRYQDMHRSAYGTLVAAGVIENLEPGVPTELASGLVLHGFPWGFEIVPNQHKKKSGEVHLAVIHRYVWIPGRSYPGAEEEKRLSAFTGAMEGYDAALFGDNHLGFLKTVTLKDRKRIDVLNCGGFIRRKSDEAEYQPTIGLLHKSGKIEVHYLDTSEDSFGDWDSEERERVRESEIDFSELVEGLEGLGDQALDFVEALKRVLADEQINDRVREVIINILQRG